MSNARSEIDGSWRIDAAEISRRIETLMEQATRLGESGWTLPMWATPFEVHQLMQRATENQDLDALFLEYYDADDGAAYESLKRELSAKPKLKRWHPMIEQCFAAFDHRLYLVVVPSMLTVLEGCIAEIGGPKDWQQVNPKQTAKRLLSAIRHQSVRRALWLSIDAFVSRVFVDAPFAGNRPHSLNRAWILHGRDQPSWTRADALRLLQAASTVAT